MRAVTAWNTEHYAPPGCGNVPYISRLAPGERSVSFEYADPLGSDGLRAVYGRRGEAPLSSVPLSGGSCEICGLEPDTDHEISVEAPDGRRSSVRLARTGYVPGTVVNYLHPDDPACAFSGRYVASPSLLRLPDGRLLASHDVFGRDMPSNLSSLFESCDGGLSWHRVTDIFPLFWGKLFMFRGALYMLGCSNEYGDLLIGRSDDSGRTWTVPTVLFRGSANNREDGWHRAPMRVHIAGGRIMTDVQYGSWTRGLFLDAVISAPEDADLLDASNWVCSEPWNIRKDCPAEYPEAAKAGGIEGSLVTSPDGRVLDLLRICPGKTLVLSFDQARPEAKMTFEGLRDIPSTPSKWQIEYDEQSGNYIALVSRMLDDPPTRRNLMSLISSRDLVRWKVCDDLIDFRHADPKAVGFQYIDFIIDGNDLIYLSRTAFNSANSFHNSNYITFHRVRDFRRLL